MSRTWFRPLTLALLAALLFAPWSAAAQRPRAVSTKPSAALLDTVLRLWTKAGCMIDPFGKPECAKEGCMIDPSGKPGKLGCMIDPNRLAAPASPTSDAGCMIDPNGCLDR